MKGMKGGVTGGCSGGFGGSGKARSETGTTGRSLDPTTPMEIDRSLDRNTKFARALPTLIHRIHGVLTREGATTTL